MPTYRPSQCDHVTRLSDREIVSPQARRSSTPGLTTAAMATDVDLARPEPGRQSKRLSKLWLLVPLLMVLASGTTWYGVYQYRLGAEAVDITVFDVKRMSFPVILTAKGEIKAKKNTEIRCEVEGNSTIVWLIEEGEQVEKGALLVELTNQGGSGGSIDDRIKKQEIDVANASADLENAQKSYEIQVDQNQSDIRKAELAVELAELNLRKYTEGDSHQARQTARLTVKESQAILDRREADLETSVKLFEKGYITKTEHENDKFNALKARLELDKAQLSEKILANYTEQVSLRTKQSNMEEAKKDLDRTRKSAEAQADRSKATLEAKRSEHDIQADKLAKLEKQRTNLKIHAPGHGMVVYHRSNRYWDSRRIEVGGTVHERQSLIDLPDPSVMQVEVKINESKMDKLDLDLPATVEVEGINAKRFTGTVTKIGVLADAQHRWLNPSLKEFTNEVTLDETHTDLKPGMTATVEILVTQLENVLAVPVQAVFGKGGHSYVFVTNGQIEYREIKLGLASTEYVEVMEGLEPGEKVCLAVDEDMKRMLPTDVGPGENGKIAPPILIPDTDKKGGGRTGERAGGNTKGPGRRPAGKPKGKGPAADKRPGPGNKTSATPKQPTSAKTSG